MNTNVFWSSPMFGTDFYHIVASFVIYSILGWFVESAYMSLCNKKITNRGFGKGPFCPIYGLGATFGYLLLEPFKESFLAVYLIGALVATIFEYFTGVLMIKSLGALWWDYNDKPYNYRGIICLESTIAWGFYAIGVVEYLNGFIMARVDLMDKNKVIVFLESALAIWVIDYFLRFLDIFKEPVNKAKNKVLTAAKDIRKDIRDDFRSWWL